MRGRKPKHEHGAVSWEVLLPAALAARLELLLLDPLTGAVRYGAKSQLVVRLLEEWLAPHAKETSDGRSCDDGGREGAPHEAANAPARG